MKFSIHFDSLTEMQDALNKLSGSESTATPEPVADGETKPVEPVAEEPVAEEKPKRRYKRRGGFKKIDKQTWPISDCLFVGVWQGKDEDGHDKKPCAVAIVYEREEDGRVRMAFIDKDGETASTNTEWFADVNDDRHIHCADPTVENANKMIAVVSKW
jgi:hypothetical protein